MEVASRAHPRRDPHARPSAVKQISRFEELDRRQSDRRGEARLMKIVIRGPSARAQVVSLGRRSSSQLIARKIDMEPTTEQNSMWMYETLCHSASSRRRWSTSTWKASCRRGFRKDWRSTSARGPVPGEMHLAAGQEPVAVGVCAHLRRRHGRRHASAAPLRHCQGRAADKMAAEIFGKATGLGRGKGGHMHLFDPEHNFSCSGIIGAACRRPAAQRWPPRSTARTGSRWRSSAKAPPTRARSTSR